MQVGWTFIPGAYRRGDSPFKRIEMSMILKRLFVNRPHKLQRKGLLACVS